MKAVRYLFFAVGVTSLTGALVLGSASSAFAQSERDRASDAVQGLGNITDLITTETMEETVTPFETDNPEEAQLSPGEFEDAIFEEKTSDSVAGQAYGATVDSALTRPDVDLGEDPFGLADDAIATSEDTVGGLFSGEGGECTSGFEAGAQEGQYLCTEVLRRDLRSCQERRVISVDRDDTWRCLIEEGVTQKTCAQDITWACTGETGPACMADQLSVTGATGTLGSGNSVLQVPGNGIEYISGYAACRLHSTTVTVNAGTGADLDLMIFDSMDISGAAQIRVDGVNVWTTNPYYDEMPTANLSITALFGSGGCNGLLCWVVAGDQWLGNCGDLEAHESPDIDLAELLGEAGLGPSVPEGEGFRLSDNAPRQITIEIIRATTNDRDITLEFQTQGRCCSEYTGVGGGQC